MAEDHSLENTGTEEFSADELAQMGKLYAGLVKNPKTREVTLRGTKIISPSTPVPEIDLLDRVGAALKPRDDKIAELEKKQLEKQAEENILRKRNELYEEGYSKSDVEAIEKLMVERQIPNHKTAGEFFKLQSKSAPPTPATYVHRPQLPINKEESKKAGGFKNYFLQDAHNAVNDLRSGKIKLNS